jgi:hypothetical protein
MCAAPGAVSMHVHGVTKKGKRRNKDYMSQFTTVAFRCVVASDEFDHMDAADTQTYTC